MSSAETNQLLRVVVEELEYIRQNTRGIATGESADADWDVLQYGSGLSSHLPGLPNNNLAAGQICTLLSEKESKGTLYLAGLTVDNPNVASTFSLKSRTNTWLDTTVSLIQINSLQGLNSFNPSGPWVSKYDTNNNIYTLVWTPSQNLGFHHGIKSILSNPPTTYLGQPNTTATILSFILVRQLFSKTQTISATGLSQLKQIQDLSK